MSYSIKKKGKPSKAALKREKNKALEDLDSEWNEFYAQLIEYGMEHGSYQVPRDYSIATDDGRTLELGAWLQVQGRKLNEYARTNPQWYSDILDLIETGKLWFDSEDKQPINKFNSNTTPWSSSSSQQVASKTSSGPSSQSIHTPKPPQPPPTQSIDYAFNSESSDSSGDDSDNSMAHSVRRTSKQTLAPDPQFSIRSKKPKSPPVVQPTPHMVKPAVSEPVSSRNGAPSVEAGHKRKVVAEPEPAPRSGRPRAASASIHRPEHIDTDLQDTDESEPELRRPRVLATRKPSPRSGSIEPPKIARINQPEPAKSKYSTESAFQSVKNRSTAEESKQAAKKLLEQAFGRTAEVSKSKHAPSEQIATKSKQSTGSTGEKERGRSASSLAAEMIASRRSKSPLHAGEGVYLAGLPAAQASLSSLPETPSSPSKGIIRPEQHASTAHGIMPPRRTLSLPKPIVAPVSTPPPLPRLSPRTPALTAAPKIAPSSKPESIYTTPTGSADSEGLSTESEFTRKIRLMKAQKEAAAAGHSSPRSDVSVAGSASDPVSTLGNSAPPPPFSTAPAGSVLNTSASSSSAAKVSYPSPQSTYSGVNGSTKRRSISEYKQAALTNHDSDVSSRAVADEAKDSPHMPPLVHEEALGTETETESEGENGIADEPKQVEQSGTGTEEEEEEEEEEEDEDEASMVIRGGRRGKDRSATPRRIDDFGSQETVNQAPSSANGASSGLPAHLLEVVNVDDDHSVVSIATLSSEQAARMTSVQGIISTVSDRAPSVLTIHSDANTFEHTPTESSSDSEEEKEVDGSFEGVTAVRQNGKSQQKPSAAGSASASANTRANGQQKLQQQERAHPTTEANSTHPLAPTYALQLSESESESDSSSCVEAEEVTNRGTQSAGGHVNAPAEFVAFAYTRSSSGPQRPMLGFGMVCNADDEENDSFYLIVMVPEDAEHPVEAEYRMDPDEFITVQRGLVLARGLTFVDGGRGGVFDKQSQDKIRAVLDTYRNLVVDTHFM